MKLFHVAEKMKMGGGDGEARGRGGDKIWGGDRESVCVIKKEILKQCFKTVIQNSVSSKVPFSHTYIPSLFNDCLLMFSHKYLYSAF